jgi:hypothetical protein
LDFELVMELEEEFDITIPDDTAERMMGGKGGAIGLRQVTIAKLAETVAEQLGRRTQSAQQAAPATGSVPGDQAPQPVRCDASSGHALKTFAKEMRSDRTTFHRRPCNINDQATAPQSRPVTLGRSAAIGRLMRLRGNG